MGLFGGDKPDPEVQSLVEQAKHDSVSIEVLSKKNASGLVTPNYLNNSTLIEYLQDEEQPHFIFPLIPFDHNGVIVDDESVSPSSGLRTNVVISDDRILIAVGKKEGDEIISIEYGDIIDVSVEQPEEEIYVLNIRTRQKIFEIWRSNLDEDENVSDKVQLALEYISKSIPDDNERTESKRSGTLEETDQEVQYQITASVDTYNLQIDGESASFTDENSILVADNGIWINEQYKIDYKDIATIEQYDHNIEIPSGDDTVISKSEGAELVTKSGSHIRIYHFYSRKAPAPELDFPMEVIEYLKNKIDETGSHLLPYEYSLSNPLAMERPTLKVEGWTDGSSSVDAEISASGSSKGKSRGVELGPFSRSKTSSSSSIEGDLSGSISDNSYTTDVLSFKLYDEYLVIDSELNLKLSYSDIDNIFKKDGEGIVMRRKKIGGEFVGDETLVKLGDGIVIQTGSGTFIIEDLPEDASIDEAIDFVRSNISNTSEENNNNTNADKLRELKELYDEDVLSKEEFESKKKEILDDI
jgi:hypothetical protein